MRKPLTLAALKAEWDYNPDTGLFTRLQRSTRAGVGFVAGSTSKSRIIRVSCKCGMQYKAHRLAWFYMTGGWPPDQIDHIDCNPRNNKFNNLRLATNSQNHCNKISPLNTSGHKGVVRAPIGRWGAQIKKLGEHHWLGTYDTFEAAAEAYREAAKRLHGEYARI